ncbi:MAG: UDP-N-acetylglucosamine 1-carboxyvinyltransferase [candidate division KSB1 bacterium]|nr:UDP-N-acetylglucosamine 1-carboxyvinyltransferase [candidate division KSB1 bacterium]
MDKIVVIGGNRLQGEVVISGAKNAVLPIMAAALLANGRFHIRRVPLLRDVRTMSHLLRIIGARVDQDEHELLIDTTRCSYYEAPYELVKTMRASIYVLGPLVARYGYARVSLPGGCAWGPRPVDLHIKGLQKLGAEITLEKGYIVARAPKLRGTTITLDIPSVGATGNLLMAATLAEGTTVIENAAREPEIASLAEFLQRMGAQIEGIGSDRLVVHGVDELAPADFEVIPDRIEAGTFLIAGAITRGDVTVRNVVPEHVRSVLAKLMDAGVEVQEGPDWIRVRCDRRVKAVDVTTAVYPGFPTDMQAQWMALMTVAEGTSVIVDTIFLDRFTHVAELRRLGADIRMDGNSAHVVGVPALQGAPVMSTDLRASASLILAGLVAEGRTDVSRVYHIDRGYERIEEKLRALGAQIWREQEPWPESVTGGIHPDEEQ